MDAIRSRLMVLPALALAGLFVTNATQAADNTPAYAVGQKAPAFEAKTTDGRTVKFPQDYKGKVVLLDFWATWCPPCRAEVPNVVKAYEQFHSKGFEVLGVSLDQADAGDKLAGFTQQHHMAWPQIYDGKFWKAEIAQQYGIRSIPRPILVDGNTGMVIAEGNDVRGDNLAPAIQKALDTVKKPVAMR